MPVYQTHEQLCCVSCVRVSASPIWWFGLVVQSLFQDPFGTKHLLVAQRAMRVAGYLWAAADSEANQWCYFGVGAPPVYFSGDWDVY